LVALIRTGSVSASIFSLRLVMIDSILSGSAHGNSGA